MLFPKSLVPLLLVITQATQLAAQQIPAESVLIRLIDDVEVPSKTAGVLSAIEVVEGQFVSQGTRLAQIDNVEALLMQQRARTELEIAGYKAANDVPIRAAQKTLVFGKSDLRRLTRAAEELPRSVSQTQLEEAKLRVDQAELELQRTQREFEEAKLTQKLKENELRLSDQNVEIREILAPLNGIVMEVARRAGEWVESGDKVFRIVRMDRVRAEGFVRAQDATRVVKGTTTTLTITSPGQSELKFSGEIVFVSPEINAVNGQVRVWAEVENSKGLLRPGLRATMSINPANSSADVTNRLGRELGRSEPASIVTRNGARVESKP